MQVGNQEKLVVILCDTKTPRNTLRRAAFLRLTLPGHSPSKAGDGAQLSSTCQVHMKPWVQLPALKKRLLKLMLEDIF